jgi:hypothetical protein
VSRLRELQRDVLLDLAGLRERPLADRVLDFTVPESTTVEKRWHVYAHGYLARLAEALEADYPAVRRILGAGAFAALAERYVRVFTPRTFDLGRAGDRLPEHLTLDPLTTELPFLPDLARLERLVAEAFVAADAELLTWEFLAAAGAADALQLPLVLAPGATILWSRWPVLALWRTRSQADDEVDVPLSAGPQSVLVVRRGTTVSCGPADAVEAEIVDAVAEGGATLSTLQARLAPAGDGASVAALVSSFRSLVERGVFTPGTTVRSAGTPAAAGL